MIIALTILILAVVAGALVIIVTQPAMSNTTAKTNSTETVMNYTQVKIEQYEEKGIPEPLAINLTIYPYSYYNKPIEFNHNATGIDCLFHRYERDTMWLTKERVEDIKCDSLPHVTENRYNNTVTIEFAEIYSAEGFPVVQTYNEQGFKIVWITMFERQVWTGEDAETFRIILQK